MSLTVIACIALGSARNGTSISGLSLLAIALASHCPAPPYLICTLAPVFFSNGSITAARNHFSWMPP